MASFKEIVCSFQIIKHDFSLQYLHLFIITSYGLFCMRIERTSTNRPGSDVILASSLLRTG
jgi:hypothetical protein